MDLRDDDKVHRVLEVFKMGRGPTTSRRNKELAAQIAQTMFLNGNSRATSKATREKINDALQEEKHLLLRGKRKRYVTHLEEEKYLKTRGEMSNAQRGTIVPEATLVIF